MSSIPQVSEAMNMFLRTRAKALERETGFVQRSTVQLDGPIFVQTCVLTWMHLPQASYSHLQHTAASLGVRVTNQAIEQRFGQTSSRLMRRLLEEAVSQVISSEATAPELLARFNGVYLQDGTVLSLPPRLAQQWQGSGGVGEEAAMRLQARVELASGSLRGLWLLRVRALPNAAAQPSTRRCRRGRSLMPIWAISRSRRCGDAASWGSTGSIRPP